MPAKTSEKRKAKSAKQDKKVQNKTKPAAQSAAVKTGSLNAEVFDLTGKVAKSMTLPKEIFGEKINNPLMTQAVLIYLKNQRAGSAWTKGRGEVTGSTRKIYRQKGTGRARHGGITAPIFVGGGVAHGPKPHDFSKKLSQRMRTKALLSALSSKQKDSAIKIIAGLSKAPLKTKDMAKSFAKIGLSGSLLFVIPAVSEMDNAKKSSRNIKGVSLLSVHNLNTYEVLRSKTLVLAQESIDAIKNHFLEKDKTK